MPKGIKVDLIGQRFGRWLVLRSSEKKKAHTTYLCRCDCGTEREVFTCSLRSGRSTHCGCLSSEIRSINNRTHGKSKTKLYNVWLNMRQRCTLPTCPTFSHYGGRGITICEGWSSYEVFESWAQDEGYKEGLTLDRIDVNGNYEPDNCRWTTWEVQHHNKTNTRYFTYKGETRPLGEWCKMMGLKLTTVDGRIIRGWPEDELFVKTHSLPRKRKVGNKP